MITLGSGFGDGYQVRLLLQYKNLIPFTSRITNCIVFKLLECTLVPDSSKYSDWLHTQEEGTGTPLLPKLTHVLGHSSVYFIGAASSGLLFISIVLFVLGLLPLLLKIR